MTTNLNADTIDFNPIAGCKPQTDIQINHAAVAACLCALVLIAVLLSPTIFSASSTTDAAGSPTQEIYNTP